MGIFGGQLANVIEWEEMREDTIFWKWKNKEIKKGSRLIIRPGQDAVFFQNGVIEGIFTDSGTYDIETQIIPFLSTLKGFKFGFNSGLRAEVLFVNIKEFLINWGTKAPINIPSPGFPGGIPIRARGTASFKVSDYVKLIDKIVGIREQVDVEFVKERIMSRLDQYLMRNLVKNGKDMTHIMSYAEELGNMVKEEIDRDIFDIGLSMTNFSIIAVTYPEEVQKRIDQAAGAGMIGDVSKLQQVAFADSMSNGRGGSSAMEMSMMAMATSMMNNTMAGNQQNAAGTGATTNADTKFCSECGAKILRSSKFCSECGARLG